MSQNKADETFQESVQALANWLIFLEEKRNAYNRQLERAINAQAGTQEVLSVTAETPGNGRGTAEKPPTSTAETGTPDEVLYDAWDTSDEAGTTPLAPAGIRLDTWDTPGNGQAPSLTQGMLASKTPDNGAGGTISLDDSWQLDEGNDSLLDEFPDWLTATSVTDGPGASAPVRPHPGSAEEKTPNVLSDNGPGESRPPDGGTTEKDDEVDPWL